MRIWEIFVIVYEHYSLFENRSIIYAISIYFWVSLLVVDVLPASSVADSYKTLKFH